MWPLNENLSQQTCHLNLNFTQQPIYEKSYPSLVILLEEEYLLGIFWVTPIRNFVIKNNSLNYVGCCNSIKILSSPQINRQIRLFSTKVVVQVHNPTAASQHKLHPGFITGFIDGEGCFSISLLKDAKYKCGWRVKPVFTLGLHIKDEILLKDIQNFFGSSVGKIYKVKVDLLQLRVFSVNDLLKVLKHFDQFPLITQKQADCELFKQAFNLILNKEHLTREGLNKIVVIKEYLNKGLSDDIKSTFSGIAPIARPLGIHHIIQDSYWLAGFASAEGCFTIFISNSSTNSTKSRVHLKFILTQHSRDEQLMRSIIEYFGCGKAYKRSSSNAIDFVVGRLSDIINKIIPFFKDNPILGNKAKDFEDWCKVAEMLKEKKHLTLEGLEQIRKIKKVMNRGRDWKPLADDTYSAYFNDDESGSSVSIRKTSKKITKLTGNTQILLNNDNSQVTNPLENNISNNYYNFSNSFTHRKLIQTGTKKSYSTLSGATVRGANQLGWETNSSNSFNQWLGGLIDGDGCFQCTKKGLVSLKIIMDIKDKKALYEIKHKYGGSIKSMANSYSLKYKLIDPKNLIKLIHGINGHIRNPIRILQLNKLCLKYNIQLKEPVALTYNNGWFSGLIDSDGSIHIEESGQLIISVTQKNKYLLEPLQNLYGGRIKILRSKEAFMYSIYRKKEILGLVDNYFNKYPLKSSKTSKLNLIKDFYQLEMPPQKLNFELLGSNPKKFKDCIDFKNKWEKL